MDLQEKNLTPDGLEEQDMPSICPEGVAETVVVEEAGEEVVVVDETVEETEEETAMIKDLEPI